MIELGRGGLEKLLGSGGGRGGRGVQRSGFDDLPSRVVHDLVEPAQDCQCRTLTLSQMKEATHVVRVGKGARREGRDEVRSGRGRGRQPVIGQKRDQSLQVERTPGSCQQDRHNTGSWKSRPQERR